jgi:hypothetical protein
MRSPRGDCDEKKDARVGFVEFLVLLLFPRELVTIWFDENQDHQSKSKHRLF